MVEKLIDDIVKTNSTNYLTEAGKRFVSNIKNKNDIKKLLADNRDFFIKYESSADRMMDDIATVLSDKNLEELAGKLCEDSGYSFKAILIKGLTDCMSEYEIPHEVACLYANRILGAVLHELPQVAPDKYDRYFQSEWRIEQQQAEEQINQKLEKISSQMAVYTAKQMAIYSTDALDLQLKRQTVNPKIGIDFFDIDDDEFINKFNKLKNDEKVCVRARCREEAVYCIINELWKSGEKRPIFVVKSREDWDKLMAVKESGNIYIPWFYADEIISIENNTNIFVFTDEVPSFSDNEIELRPRTYETIRRALTRAGMGVNEANELVSETHGLYIPMKRRIFNGAFLKKPEWIDGLSVKVKATCLLAGQWTDADGDKAVIEELSGCEYEEFIEQITKYAGGEEPFVYIIGKGSEKQYYLASVQNTWEYLDVQTDSDIWGKFTRASIDVLNESETLFTYTYAERFAARYRGEKLFWSANIRRGMLNTLLIKVLHKDHGDSQVVLDDMVSEILGYVKTEQQWKYISRYFRELCELSPSMVLDRLENEWEKSTGLLQLFDRQSDNFLFERNAYIDILSGVETMLVQKQYAARALEWLLRIDDKSYKYTSNTPESIIHKAICSWINLSAFRTVDEKVNAAKIALKYDRNGWERIYKALPQYDSNIIGNIICPHYREHVTTEWMAKQDIVETAIQYVQLLIKEAHFKPERWEKLLNIADDVPDNIREKLINGMLYEISQMTDEEKIHLKNFIRKIIYKNRYFNTAEWAQPEEIVEQYEKLLDEIHTDTPEYEYEYLFVQENDGVLLNPVETCDNNARHDDNEKQVQAIIADEVTHFKKHNLSVAKLAAICSKEKWTTLGRSLARYWSGVFDEEVFYDLYNAQSLNRTMAIDYCRELAYSGENVYLYIMEIHKKKKLDDEFLVGIYRLEAECSGEDIPQIDKAPEHIKKMFWQQADYYMTSKYIWALGECKKYGNVDVYIKLLYRAMSDKYFGTEQIYDYVVSLKDIDDIRNVSDVSYYLKEILKQMHKKYIDDAVKSYELATVEIRFFGALKWRDMKCFQKIVKADPGNYAELIAIIRRKDNDNSEKMLTEEESTYINVMCRLYGEIKFCPAERNGKVIESELRSWIEEFMILLEKNDQKSLFSYYIGKMLSYSPAGKDGYYPCEAVRNVLEDYADDALISGYVTEKYNSRGIYSPSDGRTEKSLAARYKENADYLSTIYPKTAKIYYRLCDRYKYEAKCERERAENGVY